MEEKKSIKLTRYQELLSQDVVLIGESIDWRAMGSKVKRDLLKQKGVELTLMKKSYMRYFYEDLSLFKGNIIIISFSKSITGDSLKKVMVELEKELGVLPLFLVNNKRVMDISYLKSLLKEGVSKESINLLLIKGLKSTINQLSYSNKKLIRILSKVKEE